jgi:hypothetical protein
MSGECIGPAICAGQDPELISDLIATSPDMQILKDVMPDEEMAGLVLPVVQAWGSSPCFKEKIRALKGMQFEDDVSHVSICLGLGIAAKLEVE